MVRRNERGWWIPVTTLMSALLVLAPVAGAQTAMQLFEEGAKAIQEGKVDEAIATYEAGLKKEPKSAVGHNLLGMAYRVKFTNLRSREWKDKEIAAFRKAVEVDGKYMPALVNLGASLYYEGKKREAAPYFQRALAAYPQHPERAQLEKMIREGQGGK